MIKQFEEDQFQLDRARHEAIMVRLNGIGKNLGGLQGQFASTSTKWAVSLYGLLMVANVLVAIGIIS